MSRHPVPPATPIAIDTAAMQADHAAANLQEATHREFLAFEAVMSQVGQIEGIDFTRRVGEVAIAQIFENIRQSKAYRGIPYRDENGNTRHVGDFEEFCRVKLNRSYNRCLELSQNLRLLGPALYEQSEHLGLRNIDYRAIRALPEDDQVAIKQALEASSSRDQIIDLMQELAVRHAQEKAALQGDLEKAQASAREKDRTIGQQKELIGAQASKIARRESRTLDEAMAELEGDLDRATLQARGALAVMRDAIHHIRVEGRPHLGRDTACGAALNQIVAEVMAIAGEFGIPVQLIDEARFFADADTLELDDPNAGEAELLEGSSGDGWTQ